MLSDNLAIPTGDFGIEADPRFADGGGNLGVANRNAAQCLGVRS
jgi:hypothetical protein